MQTENEMLLMLLFTFSFAKFFAYSVLGTLYEILVSSELKIVLNYTIYITYTHLQSDRAYDALFKLKCFKLESKDQKVVMLMVLMAQRPQLFKAGLAKLNMNLFVSVCVEN